MVPPSSEKHKKYVQQLSQPVETLGYNEHCMALGPNVFQDILKGRESKF
jgi:hypothetical protein